MIGFTPPLECMQFDCENTDTEPATLAVPIFPSILFMDRGEKPLSVLKLPGRIAGLMIIVKHSYHLIGYWGRRGFRISILF